MSYHAKFLLLACILLTLLPACGQRGPLYLPDESTTEAGTPQAGEASGSGTKDDANTAAANDANDANDANPAEEDDAER